jgi:hypothetical protein
MQKIYLMSILFVTIVIPIRNSADPRMHRGLRNTILQSAIFIAIWGLGCVYVYWSLPG